MNNNEVKTLEDKAKSIVKALENLENETKTYQKKNVDIVTAIANLSMISNEISKASKEFSTAASLFNSSDFTKAMKVIDERIDKISGTEILMSDQSKAVNKITEEVMLEYRNLSSDIKTINNSIVNSFEIQNKVLEIHNIATSVNKSVNGIVNRFEAIDIINIVEDILLQFKNVNYSINEINNNIIKFLEIQSSVNENNELIKKIATKLERIDRNTQKGFGKERG